MYVLCGQRAPPWLLILVLGLHSARASGAVNQTATDIVVAFGEYLAGRYNPTVGCTRSWDNTASEPAEDFQGERIFDLLR